MKLFKNLVKPTYSQEQLMSNVPVNKAIPIMSIPAMIGVLMILVTTLINTFYVGLLKSNQALTAVGVQYPIVLLLTTISMILGAGLAASIGRYLGANKKEEAESIASAMFFTGIIIALILVVFGIIFRRQVFGLFGAGSEVLSLADTYFSVMLISAFFSIAMQLVNYIASAEGNMKLGMVAFISNSALQTVFAPVFMFLLGLNLQGAAFASLASNIVSLGLIIAPYLRKKMLLRLSLKKIPIRKGMFSQVLKSGIPLGITQLFTASSIALTNLMGKSVLNDISETFIAGYGIVIRIMVMVQYLLITYMIGYQVVAAYSFGAGKKQRFWEAYRHALKVTFIVAASVSVFICLCSELIIKLFTDDANVINFAKNIVYSLALSFVISSPLPAIITCHQATKQGTSGMLISSLRQGVFYIPLVFILPRIFEIWGFYMLQPASDILAVSLTLIIFAGTRKRINSVFEKMS